MVGEFLITGLEDSYTQLVDLEVDVNGIPIASWGSMMFDQTTYGLPYAGHIIYMDGFISIWADGEFGDPQNVSDLDPEAYVVSSGKISIDSSNHIHIIYFYLSYDKDNPNLSRENMAGRYTIGEIKDNEIGRAHV